MYQTSLKNDNVYNVKNKNYLRDKKMKEYEILSPFFLSTLKVI